MAKVKLSTDDSLEEGSDVNLQKLILGAGKAVLLQFPYKGWRWQQTAESLKWCLKLAQQFCRNPTFLCSSTLFIWILMLPLAAEMQQTCTCECVSFIIDNPSFKNMKGEEKNTFHSRPVGIPSFYIQDICFEVSPPNMKNSLSGVLLLFLMKCCKSKCIVSSERNWKRINVFTPTPVGKCPVTHVRRWYQIRCRLYLQHTGVNKCVTGVYEGSRVTI